VLDRLRGRYHTRVFCAGAAWDALNDLEGAELVSPCVPGKGMLRSFGLRFRADRVRLQRREIDLVVSDGDGPSVNAARSLGIPVVAVGHGLIFRHTHLEASLPLTKRAREAVNAATSSWPADRRVAVHFAPAEPRTSGTYVARPDLPASITCKATREDFLLAYFRDDEGTEALEQLSRRGHRVVMFDGAASAPRGVEVYPYDERAFAEALGRCRAVVGSAGNHLPAECAMLGIPMLALHRERDAEHEMNARLIESAGIGVAGPVEHVDAPLLRRFEAVLEKDRTQIAARTQAMPAASKVIPQVIDELCNRRPFSLRPPIPSLGR
jgi:uncharacterized protein (TIGR00661 family)